MRSREKSRKEGKEGEGRGQKGRVEWTNATAKAGTKRQAASDPILATHRISLSRTLLCPTLTRLAGWTGRVWLLP